ncbi:hypothetical protein ACJMK2_017187 [Sinanodonta woodiana]
MTIGMHLLEKPNTPEGESVVESKPTPDTRNEPQPQGQLRLTQVRLPESTISSKPSCWDSYARDHQSHNFLQQSITPRSSHIPRESQSHPQNSPSSARETQGQDDEFTPEDRNYGIINREFQGRAIDPATGNVFEFNTRTNKIRRL